MIEYEYYEVQSTAGAWNDWVPGAYDDWVPVYNPRFATLAEAREEMRRKAESPERVPMKFRIVRLTADVVAKAAHKEKSA